jgi:hypothetical protein
MAKRSEDRRHMTVTEFDPVKGLGRELLSFNLDPQSSGSCDISPDGTQLAVITRADDPILVFSLRAQSSQFVFDGLQDKQLLSWAANGKGLLVTHEAKAGSELMFVDLKGRTKALWKNNAGPHPFGLQSPDGKHIAIQNSLYNGNMWIMENF